MSKVVDDGDIMASDPQVDEQGSEQASNETKRQEDHNTGESAAAAAATEESSTSGVRTTQKHHGRCFQWMSSHRLGWLARFPGEWPRTCSLIFGVVIPLFVLIAVSLFFGYGLARLEAPSEVEANNALIANRAVVHTATQFHGNVTKELPRMCLEIAALNQTANVSDWLLEGMDEIFSRVLDGYVHNKTSFDEEDVVNGESDTLLFNNSSLVQNTTTQIVEFMVRCGEEGLRIANRFASLGAENQYIGETLSFSWIRCDSLSGGNTSQLSNLANQIWGRPLVNRTQLKPDVQEATAVAQWRNEARDLFNDQLEMLLSENETSSVEARIKSFWYAVEQANGFDHCYANSAAGAWFWFTVMTTIGYGNSVPETQGGRAMIYTLGFLSILMFAVILGTAGTIVVTIWDDFINRTRLGYLNVPWITCIFWGFCYYAWMLVIAAVTQNWKADRLGQDMLFSEAYWFSYISTTTVGFGDIFFENEVILREDLFTFPVMFLAGFVLLANFLVKLTEVMGSFVPHNEPTLEETLAASDVPCLPKLHQEQLLMGISRTTRRSHETNGEKDEGSEEVIIKSGTGGAAERSERDGGVPQSVSDDAETATGVKLDNGNDEAAEFATAPPADSTVSSSTNLQVGRDG